MPRIPSRCLTLTAIVSLLALFITAVAAAAGSPGTISFTSATYDVDEGAGGATITLTRTGGTSGEVAAKVSVAGGTAGSTDYNLKPGETDPSFTRSPFTDFTFDDSLAIQPDGKILIGQTRTVQRLLPNGDLDPSFTRPVLNGHVGSVALLPDGKILIGGGFTIANDEARGRVARLNPDGTIDTSFSGSAGLNFNDSIYVLAATPDGKVMVGGYFTSINGVLRSHLARLNSDGTLDTGFDPYPRNNVYSMVVQPDGKVIAGGFGLNRYNTDGSLDTGFNGGASPTNSAELALALRPDGKLLVGGNFDKVNGAPHAALAQLNTDGSLDTSFNPGAGPDFAIDTMDLQPDGKLLIGGAFGVYNGTVRTHVARINTDGSLDTTLNANASLSPDNDFVYSLRMQRDGKVVVAGGYALYIKRLFGDIFVTWKDGDAQDKTISIPVVDDMLDEPDETVDFSLTPVTGGAATGAIPSSSLTIHDNDVPPTFTSSLPPRAIARLPYSHSFSASGTPSPSFSLTAGSLPPGLFLNSSSGLLSGTPFSTGTYAGISVTASNGVSPPASQTFDLVVASGGSLQFAAPGYSVNENAGSVTVTVNRVGGTAGSTSVDYSYSTLATPGTDFSLTPGTLTFADGETSKTFTVTILNDDVNERDETLTLFLNNVTGSGSLANPTFVTLTILNDDPLPTISISDATISEGDTGIRQALFTVTRTGLIDRTINFTASSVDGTALAQEDYLPLVNTNFQLGPASTSIGVPVGVLGDTIIEPDKSFLVHITSVSNATVTRAGAVGTIKDNDTATGTPSVQFGAREFRVSEGAGGVSITVSRSGDSSAPTIVSYSTVTSFSGTGIASDRRDYTVAFGTLRFAPGETSKTFQVFITDDAFVEGDETLQVILGNPTGGTSLGTPSVSTIRIVDNDTAPAASNPSDDSQFFVRQHYRDFLNREPDASGLAFWTNEIEKCGADAQCREVRRINVSAAFYLSIEFKETGYLVYRLHKAAFNTGERLDYRTFLGDTQEIGRGVVVGAQGWEGAIETNKQGFIDTFVRRAEFVVAYPQGMSAVQFVEALNANTGDPLNPSAGGSLTQGERDQLVSELTTGAKTRAEVLRAVAENVEFQRRQFSKAFVVMEYFGYLRRAANEAPDANYDGYNFWLRKLNKASGNYISAEMVKAFITAPEYRQRFGQ